MNPRLATKVQGWLLCFVLITSRPRCWHAGGTTLNTKKEAKGATESGPTFFCKTGMTFHVRALSHRQLQAIPFGPCTVTPFLTHTFSVLPLIPSIWTSKASRADSRSIDPGSPPAEDRARPIASISSMKMMQGVCVRRRRGKMASIVSQTRCGTPMSRALQMRTSSDHDCRACIVLRTQPATQTQTQQDGMT